MNNIDKGKLISAILASSGGKIDKDSLESATKGDMSALFSSLSQEDRSKLQDALSDESKAKQLLSSSAAQKLLSQLFGDGKHNG